MSSLSGGKGLPYDYLVGVVPQNLASTIGKTGSSDPFWLEGRTGYVAWTSDDRVTTLAHEVGHLIGFPHVNGSGCPDAPIIDTDGNGIADSPFTGYVAPTDAIINRWGHSKFQWDFAPDGGNSRLWNPSASHDLMSFCTDRWISDVHYKQLLDRIQSPPHVQFREGKRKLGFHDPDKSLWFTSTRASFLIVKAKVQKGGGGSIDFVRPVEGNIEFPRVSTTPSSSESFCLESIPSTGSTDSQCFDVSFTDLESGEDLNEVTITGYLNPGQLISLKQGEFEVASLSLNSNPPEISSAVISAVRGSGITISWNATDGDSSALLYQVEISVDGGTTWISVSGLISETTYTIPFEFIGKTESGLVRITVTDGQNWVSQEATGTFTKDNNVPTITLSHSENIFVPSGTEVVLSGTAIDIEDGDITGDQLVWKDESGTQVGTDGQAVVTISQLSNSYTLTATDSQGASSSVTVKVKEQIPALSWVGIFILMGLLTALMIRRRLRDQIR